MQKIYYNNKKKKIEIENFQTVYVYFFLSFIQVFRTNINIYISLNVSKIIKLHNIYSQK